ncbi:ComEA family DNA-binding protein [Streptomyces sp. NRRL WC-3742]|uniref:ComEA family DNA-binding protein n=1 Tax=Streptomyces sp. NRRL WC-3742 TaxID=1463934 RepID=UPI00099B265F|nr:ComEA family DNA-binding protein [Streptomyces sp. NRRL WC-3742]
MTTLSLGAAKKRHEIDETLRLRMAALLPPPPREEAPPPEAPTVVEPVPVVARLRFASALALDRRAVAGLTILLLFAVGYAVQHFWLGRPEAVAVPAMVAASVEPSTVAPAEESAAPVALVVDVGGRVRTPGLHTLPGGSRVADALRAAGGALPEADTGNLNLARMLTDGEQILVGEPGTGAAPAVGAVSGAGPPGAAPGAAASRTPVSLNRATLEQLDALPGVGPTLAQRILAYRASHGSFRSLDQLRQVSGIGARTYAELRPLLIL